MKALEQLVNVDAIFAALAANDFAFWVPLVVVGLIVYGLLPSVVLALFRSSHAREEEDDQLRQRMEEEIRRRNLRDIRTRR